MIAIRQTLAIFVLFFLALPLYMSLCLVLFVASMIAKETIDCRLGFADE